MTSSVTIITYHYVRDLNRSRYPSIKGRLLSEFKSQLDYISQHFTVVTVAQIIAALLGQSDLPGNAAWLTFDDGYIDHFTNVFPLLHERGWQGTFFPPSSTTLHGDLLDVNKIHFILAGAGKPTLIIDELRKYISDRADEGSLRPFDYYWSEYGSIKHAYDGPDVMFIKRILQRGLPEEFRREISDDLFRQFVSVDQQAFAAELYMSLDQLKMIVRDGMHVGSHSAKHHWLDSLSHSEQADEIDESLRFLKMLGVPTKQWVMCYPYGAYNDSLLSVLSQRDCIMGLTTISGTAFLEPKSRFKLPRIDTNEIPH